MNSKRRRRQDLRLQLLALYLIFVVPIIGLGFLIYRNASQQLRADIAAADISLARAIALETDDVLLKARAAVEAFAEMPAVIEADLAEMERAFAAGAAARQDINLFYRLSAAGIMRYHFPPSPGSTVGQDFSFRDYFKIARDFGEPVFSKGRISPTTGRPVVTSVMPIFENGRFDGVVATNLELQRLTKTVERIGLEQSLGGQGKVVIVDAVGQVIAHSEKGNLLKDLSQTLPGIENVLTGKEGSLTAVDDENVEWLYSYTPIPTAGWGVIVQRPTRLAFASLDSFQRALVMAFVIFSFGTLFFWFVLSDRVINPLVRLTEYGESIIQETVDTDFNRNKIYKISHRRDQIGRLTNTLLRAEDDLRQRLMELTTLNRTSKTVVSTLDTRQVIDTILDEVQRLLSVRQCALLVVNKATQQLEVRASRGLNQDYPPKLDLADPKAQALPAVRAITANQIVQTSDLEDRPDELPQFFSTQMERYQSELIIPLKAPHIPAAALAIYRTDAYQFSKREVDLATSFANHAVIALEHATLFSLTDAELQKQVRFLSVLNRVGHIVGQSLVMDDILANAMDAVSEAMPADACWIYLRRSTENFLRLRAQQGLSDNLVEQLHVQHVALGQGAMGWVAEKGHPLVLDEIDIHRLGWLNESIVDDEAWKSIAAVPLKAKDDVIGVLGIAARVERIFTANEVALLQAIGDQIAIAVVNARLYRRSREIATLEERNRVAREIHDTLAQGFTGILIQLEAAERLSLKKPEQAVQSLQDARELARESLQEARRSVFNLRPTVLENMGLDQAIKQQLQRFELENGIKTELVVEGYPSPLDADIEKDLYRITQEALTNVRRHAQATEVKIALTFKPENVTLNISDNGQGLPKQASQNGRSHWGQFSGDHDPRKRFGLVGIKERVELMGGRVTFSSPSTGGTEVSVEIPR